jgi:uncharacterized protein YjdB
MTDIRGSLSSGTLGLLSSFGASRRGVFVARGALALWVATVLVACGGNDSTPPKPVATVRVTIPVGSLVVGQTAQATATPLDESGGELAGRTVTWASTPAGIVDVSVAGLITAVAPGTATITATSETKSGQAGMTVVPPPVATVTVTPEAPTVAVGATTQLGVALADANGGPLTGRTIAWRSTDASVATVTPGEGGTTAIVTGVAPGTVMVIAESETKADTATVTVVPPANAPFITAVAPALLAPGVTATITGTNFGATPAENTVTINGAVATVTAASPTELTVVVPAAGLVCDATSNGIVAVAVAGVLGSKTHPVQVAAQRELGVGQSLALFGNDVRCNEFSQTGGRYLVSVFNGSTVAGNDASFQLRGVASVATQAAVAAVPAVPQMMRARAPTSALASWPGDFETSRVAAAAHRRMLDFNTRIARDYGPRLRAYWARRDRSRVQAADATRPSVQPQVSGTVGDVSSMVILRESTNFCSDETFDSVHVRTVYSGTRSIVVEDTANPLEGTMNSYYEDIGREFDNTMFDLLQTNFGEPLKLDAELDANGKIIMLFSKKINDRGGVAGYVLNCDFFPKAGDGETTFPGSNEGEVFYAIVPTSPTRGFDQVAALNPDEWRRVMRSVIIHEVKHITSFAEHFSRGVGPEETWLEEGTAMHAEELWGRTVFGNTFKGNAGYDQTLHCELRPTFAECADKPVIMLDHFARLYDYLDDPEHLSPYLTNRADDEGATFYGSTWWLVRWAIDQYASSSDAGFLRALTQEPTLTGIANLAARTGRTWPQLLADWTVMNALDDYPGFTPARAQLAEPSWNARDIFSKLNRDVPQFFAKPYPLTPRAFSFGNFTAAPEGTGISVRAGSAAYFELSGTQAGKQFLDLQSEAGAAPPATLGLSIVRVQ